MNRPNDKMTGKQMLEIAVESGLQMVPVAGGSLATLYFGTKQAKQFNRIERLYKELAEKVESQYGEVPPLNEKQQEELVDLIDQINEKVENESSETKRNYMRNFLLHSMVNSNAKSFSTKQFFLDALADSNELELELLTTLYQFNAPASVGSIKRNGVDQYAIIGAIGRLKNSGFAFTSTQQFSIGGFEDNALKENVVITSFGKEFVEYCIQE